MPAILRPTGEQNNQAVPIPPEVNPVAGTEGNLTLENAAADGFDVGEIAIRNSFKRGCHLRGSVPLCKRAASSYVEVLSNV